MKAVKLYVKPNTRFHLGRIGLDDDSALHDTSEYIHSDTLFSALVTCTLKYQPDIVEDVIEWFRSGKVKISSAFIFAEKDKNTVNFMPKPASINLVDSPAHKKIKKIAFVSDGFWKSGFKFASLENQDYHLVQNKFLISDIDIKKLGIVEEPAFSFYEVFDSTKVLVHSETKDDSLYVQTDMIFTPNKENILTGFYFLLNTTDKTIEEAVSGLVKYLQLEGIGGQRSTGAGEIERIEIEAFSYSVESNFYASLSLVLPEVEDLKKALVYETIIRGGRPTEKDGHLKRVRMMKEGAVFSGDIEGAIANISTERSEIPYLRSGKALLLPITLNDDLL